MVKRHKSGILMYRTFNGERYKFNAGYTSRAEAEKWRKIQYGNKKARIVKGSSGLTDRYGRPAPIYRLYLR